MGFGELAAGLMNTGFKTGSALIQSGSAASTLETQAQLADLAALDAIKRGEKEAVRFGREAQMVLGSQASGFAGQGLDPTVGTPLEVGRQTAVLAAEDLSAIHANAAAEAFGFRTQAFLDRGEASNARATGQAALFSGLLTGGLQAYNWAQQNQPSTPSYGGPYATTRGAGAGSLGRR